MIAKRPPKPEAVMPTDEQEKDPATMNWHVDRRIPLALIVTLVGMFLGQTIGLVIWAQNVDQRIETGRQKTIELTASDLVITAQIKEVADANSDVTLKMVRFEALLEGVTEKLKEQNALLSEIRDKVGGGMP